MFKESLLVFMGLLALQDAQGAKNEVIVLTEDNWSDMLEGQWMVKFYAPWCPACKDLEEPWKAFASWQDDLDFKCAEIDVTENPALSGRFLVTSLPTIYHVMNGEFRKYKAGRTEQELMEFIDDKDWEDRKTLPWYRRPTSPHMAAVGQFFKISLAIRDLHNRMTTEFGIPVWGSYVIFAVITIVFGLMLGLFCVCLCDCCCPQQPPPARHKEPQKYTQVPGQGAPKKDDDEDSDVVHDDRITHEDESTATGGDVRPKQSRKRTVQKE